MPESPQCSLLLLVETHSLGEEANQALLDKFSKLIKGRGPHRAEQRDTVIADNGKGEKKEDEEVGNMEKLTHVGPCEGCLPQRPSQNNFYIKPQ